MSKIASLIKSSMNSNFPNKTEEYSCEFVEYKKIVDGKFTLLVVNATNKEDKHEQFSTIVQKSVDIPEELKGEKFTIATTERADKVYPKIEVILD